MALKQDGIHFVLCPKQGNKIEGVVLNSVCILGIFCPTCKQGQGFKPSTATYQGLSQDFFRGTHNSPNAPVSLSARPPVSPKVL